MRLSRELHDWAFADYHRIAKEQCSSDSIHHVSVNVEEVVKRIAAFKKIQTIQTQAGILYGIGDEII